MESLEGDIELPHYVGEDSAGASESMEAGGQRARPRLTRGSRLLSLRAKFKANLRMMDLCMQIFHELQCYLFEWISMY